MSKSRKENKGDTVTLILLTKYIIRRIVLINKVKRIHVLKSSCYIIVWCKACTCTLLYVAWWTTTVDRSCVTSKPCTFSTLDVHEGSTKRIIQKGKYSCICNWSLIKHTRGEHAHCIETNIVLRNSLLYLN